MAAVRVHVGVRSPSCASAAPLDGEPRIRLNLDAGGPVPSRHGSVGRWLVPDGAHRDEPRQWTALLRVDRAGVFDRPACWAPIPSAAALRFTAVHSIGQPYDVVLNPALLSSAQGADAPSQRFRPIRTTILVPAPERMSPRGSSRCIRPPPSFREPAPMAIAFSAPMGPGAAPAHPASG
jgi:hypothetical protein